MKFLSLKVIPALLLFSIFAPAKVNSSMKDAYKQNNANKTACNKQTANFAKEYPSETKTELVETSPNNANWIEVQYEAYKKYYCVLSNGAIMSFSDRDSEVEEYGNTKKIEYSEPYWNAAWEEMTKGTRTEYSVEGNTLYRYKCDGYYQCLSKPTRTVVATKYYPPRKVTQEEKKYSTELTNEGNEYWSQKDYKMAISKYSDAIKLNRENAVAWTMRGESKGRIGDLKGALSDLNKAIQINPMAESYNARAIVKYQLKEYKYSICEDLKKSANLGNANGKDFYTQLKC